MAHRSIVKKFPYRSVEKRTLTRYISTSVNLPKGWLFSKVRYILVFIVKYYTRGFTVMKIE